MIGRPFCIALLGRSTDRRDGVVHALDLGDALAELGPGPMPVVPRPVVAARRARCPIDPALGMLDHA